MIRRPAFTLPGIHSARIYKTGTQGPAITSTTLASAAAIGDTTVSLAGTVPVGAYIVIAGGTSETRLVSAVTGSGPYTATIPALSNTHTSGGAVTGGTLPSFTDIAVTLGSVDFRTGSLVSTGTTNGLTAAATGLYLANVETWFTGGSAGERAVSLSVAGTKVREFGLAAAGRLSASAVLPISTAGALVTVGAYLAVGSVSIGGAGAKDTGLTLTYLGPAA